MKKFLTALGIGTGSLIGISLLIWLILPNLPHYINLKILGSSLFSGIGGNGALEYDHFDVPVPADYKQIELNGFTLRVPESLEQSPEYADAYQADEAVVLFDAQFGTLADGLPEIMTQQEIDRGLQAFHIDPPATEYALYDLLLNAKPEDFSLKKHGAWHFIYWVFAAGSDPIGTDYRIEYTHIKGFMAEGGISMKNKALTNVCMLRLYDSSDLNHFAAVVIGTKEPSVMYAIINSADIAAGD